MSVDEFYVLMIIITAAVVWGVIWGYASKAVIKGKGYDKKTADSWTWWGFFFGIIAFLVAMSKPAYNAPSASSPRSNISNADELIKYKSLLDSGVITQEEFDAKKKELL